ncbi:MAG: hypothetical protein ACP5UQ_07035 [Anaerolineae bacterium]
MSRPAYYAALFALAAIAFWSGLMSQAWAQEGPQRAALVVRFADGTVETRCVSFTGPGISGAELLDRAGLSVVINYNSGMGGAVCSIQGQGCAFPREDCFCKCQGAACEYWAYYHWQDGRWVYSDVGASNFQVTDGAIEGWSWGKGNFSSGTEPPPVRFDEICSASATSGMAAAGPAATERATTRSGTMTAVGASRDAVAPMRYLSFLLFAVALAGGWAWMLVRRRRSAPASAGERKQ